MTNATTNQVLRTDLIDGFEPAYVVWCEKNGLDPRSVGAAARYCGMMRK